MAPNGLDQADDRAGTFPRERVHVEQSPHQSPTASDLLIHGSAAVPGTRNVLTLRTDCCARADWDRGVLASRHRCQRTCGREERDTFGNRGWRVCMTPARSGIAANPTAPVTRAGG